MILSFFSMKQSRRTSHYWYIKRL